MYTRNIESLLQYACIVITILCWAAYVTGSVEVPIQAQILCSEPPLAPYASWPAGTDVVVKIDAAWQQSDRDALQAGTSRWNNNPPCSQVTFLGFEPQVFQDYEAIPPDGELHWQKADPGSGYNGGVFNHFFASPSGIRVRAAQIKILPISLTTCVIMRVTISIT